MQEMKMAPILAAMDPERAKKLTVELATRRALPDTGS
jgi:flagellar motility protein MotE (MotC chaperone)